MNALFVHPAPAGRNISMRCELALREVWFRYVKLVTWPGASATTAESAPCS